MTLTSSKGGIFVLTVRWYIGSGGRKLFGVKVVAFSR